MKTAVSSLRVLEPRSLREALRLRREDPEAIPIAGCTDVFVSLQFGTQKGQRFLNLWGLDELRRIDRDAKRLLSLGALATYTDLIRSPKVNKLLPMLVEAAKQVGGVQIQNRGTLGGNLANASPAGDTLPVLAAADATIVLRSLDETRRVPMGEFFCGYRKTVMRPDELIVAVEVAALHGRQWFRKVGTRAAQAISKVVMAGVRGPMPRIALGSVGPTVLRLRKTEQWLATGGAIDAAGQILLEEIAPIDDVRSTRAYRRRVATNLLTQFWRDTSVPAD